MQSGTLGLSYTGAGYVFGFWLHQGPDFGLSLSPDPRLGWDQSNAIERVNRIQVTFHLVISKSVSTRYHHVWTHITGPDGAVAMSSANGLVGTGFASRVFKGPTSRCKTTTPSSFSLTSNRVTSNY